MHIANTHSHRSHYFILCLRTFSLPNELLPHALETFASLNVAFNYAYAWRKCSITFEMCRSYELLHFAKKFRLDTSFGDGYLMCDFNITASVCINILTFILSWWTNHTASMNLCNIFIPFWQRTVVLGRLGPFAWKSNVYYTIYVVLNCIGTTFSCQNKEEKAFFFLNNKLQHCQLPND